jgi:hypothetical protein
MGIWCVVALACITWLSYDCIAINKTLTSTAKVLWLIGVLLLPVFSTVLYFLKEKKHAF